MEEIAIEAKNISKTFHVKQTGSLNPLKEIKSKRRDFVALDNISFQVPKGKMHAIIGFNGSGKTTLLRILAGIYQPDKGSVKIKGSLMTILHTGTGFNAEFSARENIITAGILLGIKKSSILEKIDGIIKFAELEKFQSLKLKHYSSGMRARLACATALQINPDVLLMDEILSTGDMKFREKSFKEFLSFKEKGKTILYTTHSFRMVNELAEKVIVVHKGKIVTIDEHDKVISRYKELKN